MRGAPAEVGLPLVNGLWRSLVAHVTGGHGVAGSNPVSPTERPTRGVEPAPPDSHDGLERDLGPHDERGPLRGRCPAFHSRSRSVRHRHSRRRGREQRRRDCGSLPRRWRRGERPVPQGVRTACTSSAPTSGARRTARRATRRNSRSPEPRTRTTSRDASRTHEFANAKVRRDDQRGDISDAQGDLNDADLVNREDPRGRDQAEEREEDHPSRREHAADRVLDDRIRRRCIIGPAHGASMQPFSLTAR